MKISYVAIFIAILPWAVHASAREADAPGLFQDDPTFVSFDEPAPESDPDHNSDPGADLTYMYAWLEGSGLDTLVIDLEFATDWNDMHLMIIMEGSGDAEGAPADAFKFPIGYRHALKPDYVFTFKYSAQDYADLRRWRSGRWEFFRPATRDWTSNEEDPNKDSKELVTRLPSQVQFRFPAAAIGGIQPNDTLRLQSYVTQEPQPNVKYSALDSNPHDATHDMLPDVGNWWDTAQDSVYLSIYADFVLPAFGAPPTLSEPSATPGSIAPGEDVVLTVRVGDAGGGIGEVYADLSPIGGDAKTILKDDGTGGDQEAGDGVYSASFTTASDIAGGGYTITFTGTDSSRVARRSTATSLTVTSVADVFISAEDPRGDDHGPNQMGVGGLYYVYPTNAVFKDEVFDIEGADFVIDGRYLVVRVRIGNVLTTGEVGWGAPNPGSWCTNPNKAQLNLQKIDIYMDSDDDGGATAGFPFRYVDIAERDAWEYGAAVEGWWVSLVHSNGENEVGKWTQMTGPNKIHICNDHVEDYIDIIISLEAIDLLEEGEDLDAAKLAEIKSELKRWDYIITMSGHDGDSNANNLGGIRAVNAGVTEWQFGGGSDAVGGRQPDPNLIDVLTIEGEDKGRGRSQEYLLDYKTVEAVDRFNLGMNSCVLEAEAEFPGLVRGTVTLSDATDHITVVTVKASVQGTVVSTVETSPGGGAYKLGNLLDGSYAVEASAPYYSSGRIPSVTIVDGGTVENVDFELEATTGTIAGEVTLEDATDVTTVVTLSAYLGGKLKKSVETTPGAGPYELRFLEPGSYTVVATTRGYRTESIENIPVEANAYVGGQDFALIVVTGTLQGSIALDGPSMDSRLYVRDSMGQIVGDGAVVIEGGTGVYEFINLEDGTYTLVGEARGFARFDSLFTVDQGDTSMIDFTLSLATATKYVFIDSVIDVAHAQTFDALGLLGNEVFSRAMSKSLPEDTIYFFAEILFEPRDDEGSSAIFDLSIQDGIQATVTLLDPDVPPRGNVILADSADHTRQIPDNILTKELFTDGVARFYVADDSIEVLKIRLTKEEVTGAVEVGVGELTPARVKLTADTTEATVGGTDRVEIGVQLVDVRGNEVPEAAVPIRLEAIEGVPNFEPEVDITDANGFFRSFVSATIAGMVRFTARVEPGKFEGLAADTASVLFNPGPPAEFTARLGPAWAMRGSESKLELQLVDAFGNVVKQDGVRVDLEATPGDLLASLETPVTTDGLGQAVAHLSAGDRFGIVTIEGHSDYPVPSVNLKIDSRVVAIDEEAPESDPDHNSNPDVDLTTMLAWAESDTLKVKLDFSSPWGDVLLMVALEVNGDRDGARQDAFVQPIYYGHTLKPDYVFTTKYSSEDYADFRRWHDDAYQFWDLASGSWSDPGDGTNAIRMVAKTPLDVVFSFPFEAIGGVDPGDTLRMQAYVSQEIPQEYPQPALKYNALDSTPHDLTHDMEPESGEWWETATDSLMLFEYGELVIPPDIAPPALSEPKAQPDSAKTGDDVVFSVRVDDAGGGIGDVFANLSTVGGEAVTRLNDDGVDGDSRPDDGVYSIRHTIPAGVEQGDRTIWFIARDSLNIVESTAMTSIRIVSPPEFIVSVRDSIGDDHGPNITAANGNPVEGLYYFYPTNGVFDKGTWNPLTQTYEGGVYDIEQVDLFIDGSFLVLRVHVGSIPTSQAVGWNAPNPGPTCDNPAKADLNLQKIDVYIDSKEGGGATAGLPFRFVDISTSDAWEYAVAIEGWYRALIISNGQNSISFWTLRKQTDQVDFCNDFIENYIDVKVALSALSNPTMEEIRKWDFIITMHSHDGESNDQNLGGSRWVNKATSEWQFGGGRDGEAGRERDANIMDLVTIIGEGKEPGRPQEEMLNYLLPDAMNRFDVGRTACILEASFSKDISPPIIEPFPTDGFAHNVWYVLEHAPASFWTKVIDQSTLARVEFYWRPLDHSALYKVDMVNIIKDVWIADIRPDELRSAVPSVVLVDGTLGKPFEARIEAEDEYGNTSQSSLFTFAVPDENLTEQTFKGIRPGDDAIFYDGSIMIVPESWEEAGYDNLDLRLTPLGLSGKNTVDISGRRSSMHYLDVGREIAVFAYSEGEGEDLAYFEEPLTLALHYPSYDPPSDEKKIGLFYHQGLTNRWVTVYGRVNERGNAIGAEIRDKGTYALFTDSRLSYNLGEGLSGVMAEPNPFSPNGDGLYDETRIGFFLSRDADWVTVEIYDMSGEEVRTIRWQQGLTTTGRTAFEIVWDGADDNGKPVPYGIYIARVEVRFKVAPFNERENIAIVVIR